METNILIEKEHCDFCDETFIFSGAPFFDRKLRFDLCPDCFIEAPRLEGLGFLVQRPAARRSYAVSPSVTSGPPDRRSFDVCIFVHSSPVVNRFQNRPEGRGFKPYFLDKMNDDRKATLKEFDQRWLAKVRPQNP